MEYSLNDQIGFGQYAGDTIKGIIDDDPDYISWAIETLGDFDLDCALIVGVLPNHSSRVSLVLPPLLQIIHQRVNVGQNGGGGPMLGICLTSRNRKEKPLINN